MERQGLLTAWHDQKVLAGQEWAKEIDGALESAALILLLVSDDFIASRYCWSSELKRALEKHDAGLAHVVPIIVRPCDWQISEVGRLQALPTAGRPITRWDDTDDAWLDVAQGLRRLLGTIGDSPLESPTQNESASALLSTRPISIAQIARPYIPEETPVGGYQILSGAGDGETQLIVAAIPIEIKNSAEHPETIRWFYLRLSEEDVICRAISRKGWTGTELENVVSDLLEYTGLPLLPRKGSGIRLGARDQAAGVLVFRGELTGSVEGPEVEATLTCKASNGVEIPTRVFLRQVNGRT